MLRSKILSGIFFKKPRLQTLAIFLLLALILAGASPAWAAWTWFATDSLNVNRYYHTATLLADGRVLVTGGLGNQNPPLSSAELYHPATGKWSTTSDLPKGLYGHAATLLTDGLVLVTGGNAGAAGGGYQAACLAYNPGTGNWAPVASMNTARFVHTATRLADGRVLVVGGGVSLTSAEVYKPSDDTWRDAGSLTTGRYAHTATLLKDGRVLVAGGHNNDLGVLNSAQIYDPDSNTWSTEGYFAIARESHTAALLSNGRVLLAGGNSSDPTSCEIFNPADNTWSGTGSLKTGRADHTTTRLPNGFILVAGGYSAGTGLPVTSVELFEPHTGQWSDTGFLSAARAQHSATLLADGRVLAAGGAFPGAGSLNSAELYNPYEKNTGGPLSYCAETGHWYRAFVFTAEEIARGFNSWEDARAKATGLGGYLATATSAAENTFMVNLIKDEKYWWHSGEPGDTEAWGPWLGGYQEYQHEASLVQGPDDESTYYVWKSDGQHVYADQAWKWVTGEPWSYTTWLTGYPNDWPFYETPAYERGHLNYLQYGNDQYDPSNPASHKWGSQWFDSYLDAWGYVLGYIVEWDRRPATPMNHGILPLLLSD